MTGMFVATAGVIVGHALLGGIIRVADTTSADEVLEIALGNAIRRTGGEVPNDAILHSFIVVAEWETLEGDPFVTETISPGLPEWRRLGLLEYTRTAELEDEED